MNKKIFLLISILLLSLSSDAAIYKGQKVFTKRCAICHTDKQVFITGKTKKEWNKLIQKNGEPLASIHENDKNAKESWDYFKNKRYKKDFKHLKQFLVEYAKDSGKVPTIF